MYKRIFTIIIILILSFNSYLFPASYSLESFISLVQEHSKDLKLAQQEIFLADANRKEALATALPKMMIEADYKRNFLDYYLYADMSSLFPGMPGGVSKFKVNRKNEYNMNVALSQTIFSPQIGNALRAAKEYQKLTDFMYAASYQMIICHAKTAFYQALLLEKIYELSQAAEKNAHENYLNMQNKYKNGVISQFELLQAEVRWQNSIPETAKSRRNYELALNHLKNWAGLQTDDRIELRGEFNHFPPLPDDKEFASVLPKRPDYNALLWEKKLRQTNVRAKRAAFYPTLTGSFVYVFGSKSDEWQLDEKNNNWILGLNLSIPIYTGGYRCAQVQKAKIELQKAEIKLEKQQEEIYHELKNISYQLKEAHQRIFSARKTLETAEKAFQIAETTAQNGLATQLELKDTRLAYDRARLNYYATVFEYLSAYFDWERATGEIDK